MKIAKTIILLLLAISMATCRNAGTPQAEETHPGEYAAPDDASDGIQRMNTYDYSDTLRIQGHTFVYSIHREASDSLPFVTDDFGVNFADNIFSLTVQRDGASFLHKTLTKANFACMLTDEMRRCGVLDGMRCDTTLEGLCFAVSVSQPQSDLYLPFILSVDANGNTAITRDNRSEMELE